MDISATTAPRTDQQNFDNYLAGPKTVTISEVKAGTTEQPIEIHLIEFPGQPYKPSKSMRRVLVSCWGPEAAAYVGRRMTLYGDPTVRFGAAVVGGIKISHLSDIDGTQRINLTVSRGKRDVHTVQPLTAAAPDRAWLAELKLAGTDIDLITALGKAAKQAHAAPAIIAVITQAYHDAKEES